MAQDNYKKFLALDYIEIDSLMGEHYQNRDFDKCITLMLAGKAKAKIDFGEIDSIYSEYNSNLGAFYLMNGQFEEAEPILEKSVTLSKEIFGPEHATTIATIQNLADFYLKSGDYTKSLTLCRETVRLSEKVYGNEHLEFAKQLNLLAYLHHTYRVFDRALPFYIRAKNIIKKAVGIEHPKYAAILNNLSILYQELGQFEFALPLYLEVKNIRATTIGVEHPDYAVTLLSLGLLYDDMEEFDLALPLYIQAKNIFEKTVGIEHYNYAAVLNNLSILYQRIGQFERAVPLLLQALKVDAKNLGENHPNYAVSLKNLASLYEDMGEYKLAFPLASQATTIREKVLGKLNPDYAESLLNLASLHQAMGNPKLALPLNIAAKDIFLKSLGNRHSYYAIAVNNLAVLYKELKEYELALPLHLEAQMIIKEVKGANHMDYSRSLFSLMDLFKSMGDFDKAWEVGLEALASCSGTSLSSNITHSWADSLLNSSFSSHYHIEVAASGLYFFYQIIQEDPRIKDVPNKLMIITDLVAKLLENLRNNLTDEKGKLRMLSKSNDWLKRSLQVLNTEEHSNKAFQLVEQNKSVLLLQATKSEAAYRIGELPDSLVLRDKIMLKKHSELQARLLEERTEIEKDSLRNELIQVNQEIEAFVNLIENKYPKYHQLKYHQVNTKATDIQANLGDDDALLEYVIGDSIVHIFYVDKTQVQWSKTFVGNEKLNHRIKGFHRSLSNYNRIIKDKSLAYQEYTEQAHWFYQNLVAPVLKDKKNIKNLILVTDGEVGHLPFETFLVEQAPQHVTAYQELHYLVNDYNISYNYSATLWKENIEAPTPKNNGQILGVAANYKIQLDSSMMEVRLPTDQWLREVLSPLPAARKEVETLQEKYQGFFAFDTLASEKIVKAKASDYAILHFATHGILESERPMLSSLAFSEDNDSIESNFWQAHEISKIELNANLVVLSACETGFGKFEKGNGIASLARAFMYAGASSLIVSLWQVNDFATSEIMKNLYENLANGMKKDEALRQAKIQYMKTAKGIMAHPAFWSPFIQMGNTAPLSIKRKGNSFPWMIGGLLGLLVLGGGFVVSKRKKEVV